MTNPRGILAGWAPIDEIRSLAAPLQTPADMRPLADCCGGNSLVGIGEASHGTSEFYRWRGELSRRLITQHSFNWIGVEGDWPDCWRINRWVRGQDDSGQDARGVLAHFDRWPTWMWANEEVAEFLDWLHAWNLARPTGQRVGFYGLDVYSLWDSLRQIISWLEANAPDAIPTALRAWLCFVPYREDPHQYAWSTRLVPESCEADVIKLLTEVRLQAGRHPADDEAAFDAAQNAVVAANAERYYRIMMRGNRDSWNLRDHHMADTIDRLIRRHGPGSKGMVWEHNSHIGDARATDMAGDGLTNVGQLVRERHSAQGVALVGFATHRGSVLAADSWGTPERIFRVPPARRGSHEDLLHRTLGAPAILMFGENRSGPWLSEWNGHRAIGVVYNPERELGNYVRTRMGGRYDALIWLEETEALHVLHHEPRPDEPEFETEPSGF